MTREHVLFLWLLLINLLVVIIYLVLGICLRRKKEGMAQYVLNAAVMLLCPVAGPLYFILGTAIRRIFMHREVDLEDVIFSKERVKTLLHADEERDSNMVPMEEALAVSDKTSQRRLMLNVVRGDIRNSLHSVFLGLNSEDSETAHYAASVLRDELNDFRVTVHKLYTEMMQEGERTEERNDERCRCACSLIELMGQVLPQNVFTALEQKSFALRLDEVCRFLHERRPQWMEAGFFELVILQLNEAGEYDRAEEWCIKMAEKYPQELAAYTCLMKVYFKAGWREKFFEAMESLKNSDVVLDSEALELVRMFETRKR